MTKVPRVEEKRCQIQKICFLLTDTVHSKQVVKSNNRRTTTTHFLECFLQNNLIIFLTG